MCRRIKIFLGLSLLICPALVLGEEEKKPADSITGRVVFDGDRPRPIPLNPATDAHCAREHESSPLIKEDAPVVSEEGGLANVFVEVKSGLPEGKTYEPPKEPAVLDQKGCRYIPHVLGVMVNQELEVRNSDNTNHNVHGHPRLNREFNFSQAQRGMKRTLTFDKVENFPVKCDVHPWMNAQVFVVEHPFFAVTDEDGKFAIKDLPPGEYELEFTHETLGSQTQKVTVAEAKATEIDDVKFEPTARRARPRPARR
jgi:plastocyanin